MKHSCICALRDYMTDCLSKTRKSEKLTQANFSEKLMMASRSYAALEHGDSLCCTLTFIIFLCFTAKMWTGLSLKFARFSSKHKIMNVPLPESQSLGFRIYTIQASVFIIMYDYQPRRFAKSSILKQNCSNGCNVICDGSPSRMRSVRRISFGITTRPSSSILLTMPVAFKSQASLKIPTFSWQA